MFSLRPYQADAVRSVIDYFRRHHTPSVLVLPTGAGKSLVIAELARIAKGRVLVLAHVKELVQQNHEKYESYGVKASVFSAGLDRKENSAQVVFASVQSVVRNLDLFQQPFSLLVIDECHRVPDDQDSSYQKVIAHLNQLNPNMKVLGLTATPYRLGKGWIYQYHTRGQVKNPESCFFRDCIFELPITYLMDEGYLTKPRILDMAMLSYDFSALKPNAQGHFQESEVNAVIDAHRRVTPQIIAQVIEYSQSRQGVMIFAATVTHAREIVGYLPAEHTALVIGDTPTEQRAAIIDDFKQKKIKYLVNVSVLTTGFDAPHVDLIAILRPTESVSLYQQIVGRGLRLSAGKTDCLVLEYAGNRHDLYQPEVGDPKPDSQSEMVTVPCPACGFNNNFWGKLDANGFLLEHYGRQCQGYFEDPDTAEREHCGYRFRAKYCDQCGADNDIAARRCHQCEALLVDADKKLRDALKLKDALIFQCTDMQIKAEKNAQGKPQIKVTYYSDTTQVHEFWPLATKGQKNHFLHWFVPRHLCDRHRPFTDTAASKIANNAHRFQPPCLVIAFKKGRFWKIKDKLFEKPQRYDELMAENTEIYEG